jgi:glycosyltransferase involved in cell wall biosynthesis
VIEEANEYQDILSPDVHLAHLGHKSDRRYVRWGKLAGGIRSFRPDVFQGFLSTGQYGAVIARLLGVKAVLVTFGAEPHYAQRLAAGHCASVRRCFPYAHLGLANSPHVGERYRALLGCAPRRLVCLPNPLALDRLPLRCARLRAEVRAELALAPDDVVFAHVGRMDPYKGFDTLLSAAAELGGPGPARRVLLIGDGPCRPALEAQSAALALGGRVRFLGRRGDVPRLLQGCDVFVFPSLSEGSPNAVLEAMGAGLPVIGADVSGTRELITPGRTGWLVPPADARALAAAMADAAQHPDDGRARGLAARRFVEQHHDPARIGERLVELYRQLLAAAA